MTMVLTRPASAIDASQVRVQRVGGITSTTVQGALQALAASSGVSLTSPNNFMGRQTFSYTPVYDQAAGNTLSTALFLPLNAASHIVAAGNQFNHLRISQSDGSSNQFTVGAGSLAEGLSVFMESLSGSDATSNTYGIVSQVLNDGPGTTKSLHVNSAASTGSTGVTLGASCAITPVSTSNTGSAAVEAVLVSNTGVNDVGTALAIRSTGDRLLYGIGTTIAPVPIGTAFYQAWMATASSANARALQVLNNAATEIAYIKKTGEVVSSTGLFGGTEANGVSVTAAAVTRTAAAGSITFAAGSNAGNSMSFTTAGSARMAVSDNFVSVLSDLVTTAGGVVHRGLMFGQTADFGIYFGSGAPTIVASQGSFYIRSDGASNVTRAYINNSAGSGSTWTAINTVA